MSKATKKRKVKNAKQQLKIQNNMARLLPSHRDKKAFHHYRESARALAHDRIRKLNAGYDFSYRRISIRNQKSRWGSCSKRGNLNFNYRIALLPPHLADYIIVHELMHLQELNHSPKFWNLVAHVIPNHRECRKELREMRVS